MTNKISNQLFNLEVKCGITQTFSYILNMFNRLVNVKTVIHSKNKC